jgi:outer membrane lipoprotein SlyB
MRACAARLNNKAKEIAMNTTPNPSLRRASHHPLVILAALAVVLFCLVGTAAILGWLPSSVGSNAASRQLAEADRAALAANLQQGTAKAPAIPAQPYTQPAPGAAPSSPYPAAAAPYPAQPAPYPAPSLAAQPAPAAAPPAVIDEPAQRAPARKSAQVAAADTSPRWCANCGNIESIRAITTRARGSGLGAGAGAVLGGLLGNQVGSGNGRSIATVAGAVGGAVVGNQVEGNMKATTSYEIRVRLDDGTLRTFHQHSAPPWHNGDRVRIVKGSLRSA